MYIGLNNLGLNNLGKNFSPSSLFSTGQQGVWYDPSDFSTMYQDSAGTTPVTAVEQPVGKILDKSGRGNHAIQATAANRPVVSAKYNLLVKTEAFDIVSWTKAGSSITVNAIPSFDGLSFASKVVEDTGISQHRLLQSSIPALASQTYSVYVLVKAGERTKFTLYDNSNGNNTAVTYDLTGAGTATTGGTASGSIILLGNGWYACRWSGTTGVAQSVISPTFALLDATGTINYQGDGVSGAYFWNPDLRTAADAALHIPAYQRVNTSTDYDTVGFPYYLTFNGTNSCMVTGSIDLSALNKATVFAGVFKASDAAFSALCEHGIPGTDLDAFSLSAPRGASATYGMAIRDGAGGVADVQYRPFAAPDVSVISTQADYTQIGASSQISLRRNGVVPGVFDVNVNTCTSTHFGNHTLNIGARGVAATPSSFFSGRIYSLIVRGASSSATEIANTENWVNSKTGGVY